MVKNLDKHYCHKIGFGVRPALFICDVTKGYSDLSYPRAMDFSSQMNNVNKLIACFRKMNSPVIFTRIAYTTNEIHNGNLWMKKIPGLKSLSLQADEAQLSSELNYSEGKDLLVTKPYASAFAGTNLLSMLVSKQIDTLIITGMSSSGCVYASTVDAIQSGFRTIVVKDATADREIELHNNAMRQLGMRYADIVNTTDVIQQYSN